MEIISVRTGKTVLNGVWGELVMTVLSSSVTPIIRYKTGDICKISRVQCACGNKSPRVWIRGRKEKTTSFYGGSNLILKDLTDMITDIYGISAKLNLHVRDDKNVTVIEVRVPQRYLKKANAIIKRVEGYNYETLHLAKRDKLRVIVTAHGTL